jgi:hypothetical protein
MEPGRIGKWKYPVFGEVSGFGAAARFFEISEDMAIYLFSGKRYLQKQVYPEHVIERIKLVLQTGKPNQ